MKLIDLRRDTITIPTDSMKQAAFKAELGDSVYNEDQSQVLLEKRAAEITGKEDSIFLPSGTMGNLTAILTHTHRGDEIIIEENAHIFTSETGGAAALAGVSMQRLPGISGLPPANLIHEAIRKDDIHYPGTSLICLEMSHYRSGGIVAPLSQLEEIKRTAQANRIPIHLDGARLFNAAICLDTDVKSITEHTDSVMFCLSKGLGAPAGSMLCGSREFISRARRYRKMLGGGMRQTGWLCACGLKALEPENIALLKNDHENAGLLAEKLHKNPFIKVNPELTHTNFVIAEFCSNQHAENLPGYLKELNILINKAKNNKIVFVISREVNRDDIIKTSELINSFTSADTVNYIDNVNKKRDN